MCRAIRRLTGSGQSIATSSMLLLVAASAVLDASEAGGELAVPAASEEVTLDAPGDEPLSGSLPEPYSDTLYSEPEGDVAGVSMFGIILKLGLGLAGVVLLVWGSVAVLRKSSLGKQFSANTGRVRVLERSYLGPKKSICLVRIGQRALAIGVTESNITTLAHLDDEDLPAVPDSLDGAGSTFVSQFRSMLSTRERSEHAKERELTPS